jgi:hypothetical protein
MPIASWKYSRKLEGRGGWEQSHVQTGSCHDWMQKLNNENDYGRALQGKGDFPLET